MYTVNNRNRDDDSRSVLEDSSQHSGDELPHTVWSGIRDANNSDMREQRPVFYEVPIEHSSSDRNNQNNGSHDSGGELPHTVWSGIRSSVSSNGAIGDVEII